MTVRDLMAGYTAYTNAEELMATRGTHRKGFVTTTGTPPTTTTLTSLTAATDFHEADDAARTPIPRIVRQVEEGELTLR